MLTHASLRTKENNFGSKYVKIFQDYPANVRPQESNVHGGGSSLEHICTSNPRKKMPHIIDRMIEMESNMVKHHGFRMLKSVKIAQCKGSRN